MFIQNFSQIQIFKITGVNSKFLGNQMLFKF